MKRYAFVSRHNPTQEQIDLAASKGIEIVHVGDRDAFAIDYDDVNKEEKFSGVIVVHPAAALRLAPNMKVGVFENNNRAGIGEKPDFHAKELHLYDIRS